MPQYARKGAAFFSFANGHASAALHNGMDQAGSCSWPMPHVPTKYVVFGVVSCMKFVANELAAFEWVDQLNDGTPAAV